MLLANFNGKEHLRHRAVSLRQHGFLVITATGYLAVFKIVMSPYCGEKSSEFDDKMVATGTDVTIT